MNLMNHWIFRCKDVSALISRSMDTRLPLTRRLGIRFHLMMCHFCREYKRQLRLMSLAMEKMDVSLSQDTPAQGRLTPLPEAAKARIKRRIENFR